MSIRIREFFLYGYLRKKRQPIVKDIKDFYLYFLGCHLSSNNSTDSQTRCDSDRFSSIGAFFIYVNALNMESLLCCRRNVDSLCKSLKCRYKLYSCSLYFFNDVGGASIIRIRSVGKNALWSGVWEFSGTSCVRGIPFRIDHIL